MKFKMSVIMLNITTDNTETKDRQDIANSVHTTVSHLRLRVISE